MTKSQFYTRELKRARWGLFRADERGVQWLRELFTAAEFTLAFAWFNEYRLRYGAENVVLEDFGDEP